MPRRSAFLCKAFAVDFERPESVNVVSTRAGMVKSSELALRGALDIGHGSRDLLKKALWPPVSIDISRRLGRHAHRDGHVGISDADVQPEIELAIGRCVGKYLDTIGYHSG
jgi:hypothetical protein